MSKELYTPNLNIEINDNMARLVSKDKKEVLEALGFKDNLIEYLEDELNLIDNVYLLEETDEDVREYLLMKHDIFKNLLERIKSGKYE